MVCLTANTPHSWNCTEIASSWKQAVNSTIGHSPLPKMQVACQMVHWIQQALIERSMDGEARANKNEGGSADHVKGHDEISHDQEMVSSEVHKERGGDEEVHEARESDERACGVRAGCNRVHKVKESDNKAKESDNEVKESGNEMKESGNEAKESSNEACRRRAM